MTSDTARLIARFPASAPAGQIADEYSGLQHPITLGSDHPSPSTPLSNTSAAPGATWQHQLANTLNDLPSLLEYISLDIQKLITFYESEHQGQECQDLAVTQTNTETTDRVAGYLRAAHDKRFPLRVPRAFADRIVPNQPGDPLLRQVLPLPAEQVIAPGYNTDPLAEQDSLKGQGLLQKYQGRLLVVAHGSCAVHCRYCFRRHFPYDTQQLPPQHWQALASHLAQDTSLDEVILSGGDPLTLKNRQLQQLNPILTANPHIKRLRIHTRFPIMIPDRIDAGFVAWANTLPIPLSIVFHINHANEIDSQVTKVLKTLKSETKALLLNQSVLLKNVNDSVPALQSLQELLIENGIMPYYLHVLDPIQGAQHFDVPDTKALSLLKSLQQRLPGYMVPKLVREMPGADSKTLLTPN